MLTIRHLAKSQFERIIWLFEEIGLPYQLVRYRRTPPPATAPDPAGRSERAYRLIEARLGEARWFAGDTFTDADVMMCLPRFAANRELSGSPDTAAYLARLSERAACRTAMAKAELPR